MEKYLAPVAGRRCGPCHACCVSLRIESNEFLKHEDVPCEHLAASGGCGIYSRRPNSCRGWHCGWRYMESLGDEWRPDRCGVLIRQHDRSSIVFQALHEPDVFMSPAVLNVVACFIGGESKVFISFRGKEGYANPLVAVDELLEEAVGAKDLELARSSMRTIIDQRANYSTKRIRPLIAPSQIPTNPPPRRTEPCPCGSGERFKRCHGSEE